MDKPMVKLPFPPEVLTAIINVNDALNNIYDELVKLQEITKEAICESERQESHCNEDK